MFQEPHHADHGDGHSDEGHDDDHKRRRRGASKKSDKDQHDDHGKETFMVPDSTIYVRPAFIPNQRFYNTFFVWVSDSIISEVMKIFDDTVFHCDQFEHKGIYHPSHRFLVFVDPVTNKS